MDYELKFWEALLSRSLSDPTIVAQLEDQLTAENRRIRLALLETACSNLPVGTIENQMRVHQEALVSLDERISQVGDTRINAWLEQAFVSLHDDLETALTVYWPRTGRVPRLKLRQHRSNVRGRMEPIRLRLLNHRVSTELTALVTNALGSFAIEGDGTYEAWYKMKGLMDALERTVPSTDKVIEILLDLDVDDYGLFRFLQERISGGLAAKGDASAQLIWLREQLGYIRHHKEQGKLRSIFCVWLEALIQDKQREAIESPVQPLSLVQQSVMAAEGGGEQKMILTSLSSSELGCMIRLFIDTEVFANDNIKAVAQFMAQFVGTKKKGAKTTRSVNNLYANIYTIPESTSNSVDRILQTMMERNAELRVEAKEKDAKKKRREGNA